MNTTIFLVALGWIVLSCLTLLGWIGVCLVRERRTSRRQLAADAAEEHNELRYRAARRSRRQ